MLAKLIRIIISSGIFLLYVSHLGLAKEKENEELLKSKIDISFGREFLSYVERDPVTKTESDTLAKNQVLRFDAFADLNHNIFGLKGVVPTTVQEVLESWDSLGYNNYQKDNLKYQWVRYDGYYGYSFYYEPQSLFYTLYIGARWSKTKFERSDFIILKIPQNINSSTEEVKSIGVLLGIRGEGLIKQHLEDYQYRDKKDELPAKWGWGWGFEAMIPLQVKMTNSTLPGITFKDKSGYTFELNGLLSYYILPEKLSIDAVSYVGNMYWKGSDWKDTVYGRTKWPKNNTGYLGITLGLTWRF